MSLSAEILDIVETDERGLAAYGNPLRQQTSIVNKAGNNVTVVPTFV